jgi:allophanate hydrolase
MGLTISSILAAHAAGARLADTIAATYARIAAHDDPALFIALRPKAEALARAAALQAAGPAGKPLFGVPFVVKDNIDVAGLPTTAACPAFLYRPERSAFVVARLEQAGAIAIGKTNLDQFATGLVGVRSPYGAQRVARRAIGRRATRCAGISFPAAPAPVRRPRSGPGWFRSRSAPIRRARAASRPRSTASSA